MSTPRKRVGGPANVTADIAQRAWKGTVASAVLVPTMQLILLEFANTLQPIAGNALAVDPISVLSTAIVVLSVLPVVSTLVSMAFAYVVGGWLGVVLYYLMSIGASMMLGAELTGAIIFITGVGLFLLVAAFKMRGSQQRRRPHPPV